MIQCQPIAKQHPVFKMVKVTLNRRRRIVNRKINNKKKKHTMFKVNERSIASQHTFSFHRKASQRIENRKIKYNFKMQKNRHHCSVAHIVYLCISYERQSFVYGVILFVMLCQTVNSEQSVVESFFFFFLFLFNFLFFFFLLFFFISFLHAFLYFGVFLLLMLRLILPIRILMDMFQLSSLYVCLVTCMPSILYPPIYLQTIVVFLAL